MQIFRRQIVCANGESRAGGGKAKWLIAFWLPVPYGKRIRRNLRINPSCVSDAQPFELRALEDGALLEVTATFVFPLEMPMSARREIIDREWRAQLQKRFGSVPEAELGAGLVLSPGVAKPGEHELNQLKG